MSRLSKGNIVLRPRSVRSGPGMDLCSELTQDYWESICALETLPILPNLNQQIVLTFPSQQNSISNTGSLYNRCN